MARSPPPILLSNFEAGASFKRKASIEGIQWWWPQNWQHPGTRFRSSSNSSSSGRFTLLKQQLNQYWLQQANCVLMALVLESSFHGSSSSLMFLFSDHSQIWFTIFPVTLLVTKYSLNNFMFYVHGVELFYVVASNNRLIWRDDVRMDLDEWGKIESVALRKVKHLGGTLCSSLDFNFHIQISS